jgi:hypothetical protein
MNHLLDPEYAPANLDELRRLISELRGLLPPDPGGMISRQGANKSIRLPYQSGSIEVNYQVVVAQSLYARDIIIAAGIIMSHFRVDGIVELDEKTLSDMADPSEYVAQGEMHFEISPDTQLTVTAAVMRNHLLAVSRDPPDEHHQYRNFHINRSNSTISAIPSSLSSTK